MDSIFKAAKRAFCVVAVWGLYTLNPDTTNFSDVLSFFLRALHAESCQTLFAVLTLIFYGLDGLSPSLGSYASVKYVEVNTDTLSNAPAAAAKSQKAP